MRNGMRVIDADRHVFEPLEMWRTYLDPRFRDDAPIAVPRPVLEPLVDRVQRLGARGLTYQPVDIVVRGQPIMRPLSERAELALLDSAEHADASLDTSTPEAHLTHMDGCGVDVAFCYPSTALYIAGMEALDPELAQALVTAYNRWLHDFCSAAPERLHGVGLVAPHAPKAMVETLDQIAAYGWRAVVLRPNLLQGRSLSHPDFDAFWAACAERSLAVALHEGAHSLRPAAGADRYATRFGQHACSHPMEQMMGMLDLIEGGILERHPELRVGFFEAGCGWIPPWLWRLDEVEYKHLASEVSERVKRKPSEYVRRQCFATLEPGEPGISEALSWLGANRLLFGTDFPHADHQGSLVDEVLRLEQRLPPGVLAGLLGANAEAFYGLPSVSR